MESTEAQPVLRANRQQLRRLLSTNVDVHWGAKVTEIILTSDGVDITVSDGSTYHGDAIVGADGIHSRGMFDLEEGKRNKVLMVSQQSARTCSPMPNPKGFR